jgi:hypothetical protein
MSQLDSEDKKLLRDIHTSLIGNNLGTEGLISRMESVEKKADCNKKTLTNIKSTSVIYGTSAGTGAAAIIAGLKAWWMAKFG